MTLQVCANPITRIYSRKFSLKEKCEPSLKRFLTIHLIIYLPNEHFEYGYPHSNAFLHLICLFGVIWESCKVHKKVACHCN